MNRLSDILKLLGDRYPRLAKRVEEAEALMQWDSAVGPAIAKHARPVRVERGTLWLEVDHPIWQTELHHRKRQILDKLNAQIKNAEAKINDLHWVGAPTPAPLRGLPSRKNN